MSELTKTIEQSKGKQIVFENQGNQNKVWLSVLSGVVGFVLVPMMAYIYYVTFYRGTDEALAPDGHAPPSTINSYRPSAMQTVRSGPAAQLNSSLSSKARTALSSAGRSIGSSNANTFSNLTLRPSSGQGKDESAIFLTPSRRASGQLGVGSVNSGTRVGILSDKSHSSSGKGRKGKGEA